MADATTDASSPCSDNFDYEGMKKLYAEQVELYYSNKRLPMISPYTRKVVDKIKHIIQEKQVLMAAGHPSEHVKYKVADRYEVIERNGEEILIIKRLEPHDRIVQILPAEDCFDILMNAHLQTMHGGKDKILQVISGKYVVPNTSIDFLLALCEVCRLMGNTKPRADENKPQKFNSRAQVSLVDMSSQPDNQFKYILCYLDRFTRYMLLRPLMTNSVQETAMEIMKIFLDFGPPDKIETYNRPFFQKVTSLVNTAHRKFDIPLVLPVKMLDINITPNNVRSLLLKWTIDNNCSNWAMGCYMVQWNNNSTSNMNKGKTPYESVFKTSSPDVASSSKGNLQEHEKSSEAELNNDTVIDNDLSPTDVENKSSSPIILESDNDTNSQTTLVDDGDVTVVNESTEISDDDDDCLITFTEIPEPVTAIIRNNDRANTQKRPNILAKRTSVEDTSRNVTTGTNPNNNPRKRQPIQKVQRTKFPAPTNTICHICKTGIKKAYICTKCNRNVHLFCSDRLLQPNISADVLTVTCTTCRLCNSRLEKLKRKFDEMDDIGDKTNVTIKH